MNDKDAIYTNIGNIVPKKVTNITLSNKRTDKSISPTHKSTNPHTLQQRKPSKRTTNQASSTYKQIIFNQVTHAEKARLQIGTTANHTSKSNTRSQSTSPRVNQSPHSQSASVGRISQHPHESSPQQPKLNSSHGSVQHKHHPPRKQPKSRHSNKPFISYIKDYDGSNLFLPYVYESLLKFLAPYGLSAILEIIVTVTLIAILIYPFHLNAANTNFDFKAPNALLLQEAPAHPDAFYTYNYSGTYLPQSLVETEPIISGVLRYKNKQTIVIKIDNSANWQEIVAKKIEAIIHAIIDNRTPELFNVEGKNLVFCVQVKDVTHYSCYLPYDAIRGYTRDNSQNVLFIKQLKYYGKAV